MEEGDRLGTNLIVERELGAGAMGTVWLARNEALGSHVAVKVLRQAPSAIALERFMREARGVAKLDHPHIVRVFDCGTAPSGEPFVVMELLRGEDLASKLEKTPVLPVDVVVQIAAQVCKALAAVAPSNVVHRDIKPANLFLLAGEDVFVKVLDFGVARFEGEGAALTRQGSVIGTPLYMSPEQIDARDLDARSDLWSLAVVVYECLTGALPFSAESTGALAVAISRGAFLSPSFVDPGLPSDLDAFFAQAFAIDPDRRFQTPREFSAALSTAARAPASGTAATKAPAPATPMHSAARPGLAYLTTMAHDAPPSARVPAQAATDILEHSAPSPPAGSMASISAVTPEASPRAPIRRYALVALVLVVAGLASGLALRGRGTESVSSDTAAPPSSSVVTLLDLPGSKSENTAAVATYRSAILALHDGNWAAAMDHLEKAYELDRADPQILARRAIVSALSRNQSTADRRARFIAAHGVRDRLSARDAALLLAVEPLVMRDPLDFDEAIARLERLVLDYPADAELRSLLGDVANDAGNVMVAIPHLEEAMRLDPKHSDTYQALAEAKRSLADVEGALATLNDCIEEVPGSGDCRVLLAIMLDAAGRCADAERTARQALALQPRQGQMLSMRSAFLFAIDPDPDIVGVAFEARWEALSPFDRSYAAPLDEARLAAVQGNFDAAWNSTASARAALSRSNDARAQGEVADIGAWLALEMGDHERADEIATTFMKHSVVWPAPPRFSNDPTPVLLFVRRVVNATSDGEVSAQRDAWIAKWQLDPKRNVAHWAAAYAAVAASDVLAREALDAAPASEKLRTHDPSLNAMIGRTLFRGGRLADATELLRETVKSCRALNQPFILTHAQLWLAEATSDKSEACKALDVVITRFGRDARSSTAKRARELGEELGCVR